MNENLAKWWLYEALEKQMNNREAIDWQVKDLVNWFGS